MKTREFIIKTESLAIAYDDSLTIDLLEEYVFEDLEIPIECVESLKITYEMVNIKLSQEKIYFNDDWYVNLLRIA